MWLCRAVHLDLQAAYRYKPAANFGVVCTVFPAISVPLCTALYRQPPLSKAYIYWVLGLSVQTGTNGTRNSNPIGTAVQPL